MDKRMVLDIGYKLKLNVEYMIEEIVGRGGSSIVYDASYKDNLGLSHKTRIKEFYPYNLKLTRKEKDGSLIVLSEEEDSFEKEREKFKSAYQRNVDIKRRLGLINSTVNAINIYEKNNTIYIVMNYDEGRDYSNNNPNDDRDLQSIFIRLKAVAEIIKKYHSEGFLHLDIKPENIMIIPETKEHIILFDFDSIITKEELKNKDFNVLFSEGFAAPEQVEGQKDMISEATDIYAIGALLFYKIFNEKYDYMDDILNSKIDYSKMIYQDKRYQPVLLRELDRFFSKTLRSFIGNRWEDMDQVLESLNELIRLADIKNVFLYENFNYNTNCFVGRTEELEEIEEAISENQILFIHGIGGIGKTEIVKRFVYKNRNNFDTVVFVPFKETIVETITGTDIRIGNFSREEEEDVEQYFERKINALKTILSKQDLIILDNFDVSEDDKLEILLECPCKFLITTREDFRDYNYPQIDICEMKNINDLLNLFYNYNSKKYNEDEMSCITEIIELVERHTMTVELIAKYLRDSRETVYKLREKLYKSIGITGTKELPIKHRKDRKRRSESINNHLATLFDLSKFSKSEREIIMSLSLLGYIRIQKDKFLEYCCYHDSQKNIKRLIRRGWIQYEEKEDKISLHQVVLDLVYNHLKPTSKNCPAITKGMTDYVCKKMENTTDENVRKRLVQSFLERISGSDDVLAKFYLAYCIHIKNEELLLNKIEDICEICESRCHNDFRKDVSIQRIEFLFRNSNQLTFKWNDEEYLHKFGLEVVTLADKAIYYMKKLSYEKKDEMWFYVKIGTLLKNRTENIEGYIFDENCDCLDTIYTKAQEILEKAAELAENSDIDYQEKVSVYKKMLEFYKTMDFSYRSEHYGDNEKLLYFSNKIEKEREKEKKQTFSVILSGISYEECGDEKSFLGDHDKALEYYLKALKEAENKIERNEILLKLAKEYTQIEKYEKAKEYLLIVLKTEEEDGINICSTCNQMIDLLWKQKDISLAKVYCEKAIQYQEQRLQKGIQDDEDYQNDLMWLIVFYTQKYKIVDKGEKDEYFEKGMEYYSQYYGIDSRICDFLELMCRKRLKEESIILAAKQILDITRKYKENYEYDSAKKIVNLLLEKEGRKLLKQNIEILVEALCSAGDIFEYESDYQRAKKCYIEAQKKVGKLCGEQGEYLSNLVLEKLGGVYDNLGDYEQGIVEKNKCDYFLLAEMDGQEKTQEEQRKLWEDAAESYSNIRKYKEAERCFQKLFELWKPGWKEYENSSFEDYWKLCINRINVLLKQELFDVVFKNNTELYQNTIDFYQGKVILMKQNKEQMEIINNLCYKLNTIAENYKRAFYYEQAIIIYLIGLIIAIEERIDIIDLNLTNCFEKTGRIIIVQKITALLERKDISKKMVDIVIDTFEESIKNIELESDWLPEIMKKYASFTKTYQYQEVDFKR